MKGTIENSPAFTPAHQPGDSPVEGRTVNEILSMPAYDPAIQAKGSTGTNHQVTRTGGEISPDYPTGDGDVD